LAPIALSAQVDPGGGNCNGCHNGGLGAKSRTLSFTFDQAEFVAIKATAVSIPQNTTLKLVSLKQFLSENLESNSSLANPKTGVRLPGQEPSAVRCLVAKPQGPSR